MEKGLGTCLIQQADNTVCGKQIEEGEPIGTIMSPSGPLVGHRNCAAAHYARKMQTEREKRDEMVKIARQSGPGGAVDMSTAEDAIENSTPLVKPDSTEKVPLDFSKVTFTDSTGAPDLFTEAERAELENLKQKLLSARAGMVTEEVGKVLSQAEHALAALRSVTIKLMDAYDKVVAERDQARSERDSARAASS